MTTMLGLRSSVAMQYIEQAVSGKSKALIRQEFVRACEEFTSLLGGIAGSRRKLAAFHDRVI